MGGTCSSSAHEAELENRRLEREMRLGLVPRSYHSSPHYSVRDLGMAMSPHPNSVPGGRRNIPFFENRTNSHHNPPRQSIAHNIYPIRPQARANLPRQRLQNYSYFHNGHPPFRPRMPSPGRPPGAYSLVDGGNMGKTKNEKTTATKQDNKATRKMENKKFLAGKKEDKKKHANKPKVKPVVIQALNMLCVEEMQCRAEIMNEAIFNFKSLEDKLASLFELENIRASALELFKLQSKSRAAVIEQELKERDLLVYWMHQTLEEDRLNYLIDVTQKRHHSYGSAIRSPSNRGYGWPISSEKTSTLMEKARETLPSNLLTYHKNDNDRDEIISEKMTATKRFDGSTPDFHRTVSFEEDTLSDDLNRKIGRQTYLIRRALPSYSPKRDHAVADVSSNNIDWLRRENSGQKSRLSDDILPPPLPYAVREEDRSLTSYRSTFLDPFKTPRRKTSLDFKKDSDLAMKRRLAALLTL